MKIKIYQNGRKTYNINSSSSGNFNGYITADNTGQLTTRDTKGNIVSKNGSVQLPNITVTPQKYSSAFDPNGAEQFYDAATLGLVPNPFKLTRQMSNGDLKGAAGTTLQATSFGNGVGGALSRLLVGTHNLVGSNGVSKTYNLFKNGQYAQGIKSGIGDVLDGTMALDGGKYAENGIIKGVEYGTKKLLGKRAAIAAYNNITPFGYSGHQSEMLQAAKQFITPGKLDMVDKHSTLLRRQARHEIFKKYLGLGDADYFYKDTGKFDSNGYPIWTYNLDHIPEKNIYTHMVQLSPNSMYGYGKAKPIKDFITGDDFRAGNGGNLTGIVKNSANGPAHVYDDIWDLQPFQNLPNSKFIPNKLMNKIRNFEVSSLIGDKPIHVINEIPIKPYNPEAAREWQDTFDQKTLLEKNKFLFYEWLQNANFAK